MHEPLLEPESALEGIALASKDSRHISARSTIIYLVAFTGVSAELVRVDEGEALQGSETRLH